MTNLEDSIHELLASQLKATPTDVVEVIPLPRIHDRVDRLQAITGILEKFDQKITDEFGENLNHDSDPSDGMTGYFVWVKARRDLGIPDPLTSASPTAKTPGEGIYLANGQLNISFLFKNAELLLQSGEFSLARNVYRTILSSGEKTALALLGVATCFEKEGKYAEAQKNFEESIAYNPTLDAYQGLIELFAAQRKFDFAADAAERALSLKELTVSQRAEKHFRCAGFYIRAAKPEPAEKHLSQALELDPYFDQARTELGNLFLQNSRVRDAKRCFQDAIASNPRNDKALIGLGNCYWQENEKRQAHDHFAQALGIELKNPSALLRLVQCAYEIKSFSAATRFMEQFIEFAPENTDLLYTLAGLQFHLGKVMEARDTITRLLKLAPEHPGAKELSITIDRLATTATSRR